MKSFLSAFAVWLLSLGTPLAAQEVALPASPAAWSAPEREIMVPVQGGSIWVRIDGDLDAENPPAIFVHGGPGGTHAVFGGLVPLAEDRAIIMYDQLDSGKSDRPEAPGNWRIERFVDELEAIRKALGIERWHVIGHSWGSALALRYAVQYPQHTASAVLGGTFISTPHWIMGTNLLIRELPDPVAADLIACESDVPPSADRCAAATRAFYAEYNGRADRPAPSEAQMAYRKSYRGQGFNETLYNAMWGPSEFAATGSLLTYNDVPLLSRVDGNRILYMIGQYDEARIDDVQEFVELTPGSEFAVVPGGSHGFPIERPVETGAILRGWMDRIDAKDAARDVVE